MNRPRSKLHPEQEQGRLVLCKTMEEITDFMVIVLSVGAIEMQHIQYVRCRDYERSFDKIRHELIEQTKIERTV